MKRISFVRTWVLTAACLLGMVAYEGNSAVPEPFWYRIQLIWGTNDQESPDPKHKAIDDDLAKKLGKSPFRWKHYFEVNRSVVSMSMGEEKTGIKMSSHCTLDLKNLGKDRIETKLYGKGKLVSIHKETLPKDWPLILAGNAENETAWLVVIKRIDANDAKAAKPIPATVSK
jgi:hypothetical protein